MKHTFVETNIENNIMTIRLNDPSTLNAIGPGMAKELLENLDGFENNPSAKVLILTGTGRAFCSGANVKTMGKRIWDSSNAHSRMDSPWQEMETRSSTKSEDTTPLDAGIPLRIYNLNKPSIAAVNGHAIGLGMGIAAACDLRIASENATFSQAFVRVGLVPGDGSSWLLPRLIGRENTLLLQYTGDRLEATEAHAMGLTSKVVPHDNLMSIASALAARIGQKSIYSTSLIKYLANRCSDVPIDEGVRLSRVALGITLQTEDHKEAVRAFIEKREPVFKDR